MRQSREGQNGLRDNKLKGKEERKEKKKKRERKGERKGGRWIVEEGKRNKNSIASSMWSSVMKLRCSSLADRLVKMKSKAVGRRRDDDAEL